MRSWITVCSAVALLMVATIGCQKTETKGKNSNDNKTVKTSGNDKGTKVTKTGLNLPDKICGQCGGEAKEACCDSAKEAGMCSKCGFGKGTFLCCSKAEKIEGAYCGKCGAVAGSDTCCKGDKCEKCGLNAGSALCCKLKSGEEGHDHKEGEKKEGEKKEGESKEAEGKKAEDKTETEGKKAEATKTE